MSIITKPTVVKGSPATFTLNKAELLLHPLIVADSYFSNSDNWFRVNVIYKSSTGSQYEVVEFDASQSSPTGIFLVSEKARDLFQIQKVQILDFDGGFLEIYRNNLVAADWDVSFGSSAILSTSDPGDFTVISPTLEFNTTIVLDNLILDRAGAFYVYGIIYNITLNEAAAQPPLVDTGIYKMRVYFNSFSTLAVSSLTMGARGGYGYTQGVLTGAQVVDSFTTNGYVDVPVEARLDTNYNLGIWDNDGMAPEKAGQTSFSISKIEILPG